MGSLVGMPPMDMGGVVYVLRGPPYDLWEGGVDVDNIRDAVDCSVTSFHRNEYLVDYGGGIGPDNVASKDP